MTEPGSNFFKILQQKTTSITTSTSIKEEAKLNFASSCPVACTDYSFFLSIDTGEFVFFFSIEN